MEQQWVRVKALHELDAQTLGRWKRWLSEAAVGTPVRVLGETTVLEVLGSAEGATAWQLTHQGDRFLKGLVVWRTDGWGQAGAWAGGLASDIRSGEMGGTAGFGGAARKYDTELPVMVTSTDRDALVKWVGVQRTDGADWAEVGTYIARTFVEVAGHRCRGGENRGPRP